MGGILTATYSECAQPFRAGIAERVVHVDNSLPQACLHKPGSRRRSACSFCQGEIVNEMNSELLLLSTVQQSREGYFSELKVGSITDGEMDRGQISRHS